MMNDKEPLVTNTFGALYSRLFHGVGAQTYAQTVQILIRLAEVPLLLSFWNPELYGEWLIISAIPAYLSMGDIGFSTTAAREMTILNSANNKQGTLRVFQSTWVLLLILSGFIFVGTAFFVYLVPLGELLGLQQISDVGLTIIVLALVADVLLGFQAGLLNGSLWAVGCYPLGIGLSSTMQLLGFVGLALGLVIKNDPVIAALGYFSGKLLSLFLFLIVKKKYISWLGYGFRYAQLQEVRRLTIPALASLAFPLGNAFNIQGIRVIIGIISGPAAVALFVPLRTLANFAMQPRRIVNQLIQPELGLAYGSQDSELFNKLVLKACQLVFWAAGGLTMGLALTGDLILSRWTVGKITMHWPLYLFLLGALVINSLWNTALMVPYATNRHSRIAGIYTGVYGLIAFVLAFFLVKEFGVFGAGVTLLVVELAMLVIVLKEALKMSDILFQEWTSHLLKPPVDIVVSFLNKTKALYLNSRSKV